MRVKSGSARLQILWLAGASLVLALMAGPVAQAQAAAPSKPAAAPQKFQQDRLLKCTIGHVINFDPHVEQTPETLRYDGFHEFNVFLPGIPVQVGRPPDAVEDAPAVDPRTRILRDPDHISGQPNDTFGRIIDLWPERVELSTSIDGPLLNLIVINPIDLATGTAQLFMLRATELTNYQQDHIYQGACHILTGAAAHDAATPSS